jgi:hypothetical protein
MAADARPGAVFIVPDEFIAWPASRGANRGHETRWVIVFQSIGLCAIRNKPDTLTVIPCSSSGTGGAAPWDYLIPPEDTCFTKPRVVAYVSLAQPILKIDLRTTKGHVLPSTLAQITAIAAKNMGLIAAPLDIPHR